MEITKQDEDIVDKIDYKNIELKTHYLLDGEELLPLIDSILENTKLKYFMAMTGTNKFNDSLYQYILDKSKDNNLVKFVEAIPSKYQNLWRLMPACISTSGVYTGMYMPEDTDIYDLHDFNNSINYPFNATKTIRGIKNYRPVKVEIPETTIDNRDNILRLALNIKDFTAESFYYHYSSLEELLKYLDDNKIARYLGKYNGDINKWKLGDLDKTEYNWTVGKEVRDTYLVTTKMLDRTVGNYTITTVLLHPRITPSLVFDTDEENTYTNYYLNDNNMEKYFKYDIMQMNTSCLFSLKFDTGNIDSFKVFYFIKKNN